VSRQESTGEGGAYSSGRALMNRIAVSQSLDLYIAICMERYLDYRDAGGRGDGHF
jgi:hypothetical protein